MPARKFTSVTVQDMKLATPQVGEKVNAARIYFADHIAIKLKKTGRFASVARNAKPRADMLVIEGVITKYDEGNMAKRAFVGMGFGMAFVEANVEFRDGKGVKVGSIKVDKHSWALGGWIAAIQNAEDFMDEAADKIAQEAVKLAR